MATSDVVIIGAGVIGAACAYYAARAGLTVTVVDRGPVAGGTSGAGEGNILVSDRTPGPELGLGLLSARLWRDLAADLGDVFEYEAKGGLVVARTAATIDRLREFAVRQRTAGVEAVEVAGPDGFADYEPHLAPGFAGGMFYPQDAQVQPMLAAAHMLRAARERHGARVLTGVAVTGLLSAGGRITGVRTTDGDIGAGAVVNAAGTWGGEIARMAGLHLPIRPRRGFILVTEPLPARAGGPLIRHKVYTAQYMANVASDAACLETSAVVEGTRAGTVLIGASRERVGFDRTISLPVLRRLARQAIALFPVLAEVAAIRAYCGFRPYSPDHLPVIGADPRAPGLLHAGGHEGGGIGMAAGTGHLIAQVLTGVAPGLDLAPFRPDRFAESAA
ncbi:MAG TPA: FAD-dependent oxidoreductase [Streptosporangiaceae bacterium]|nr:FAD-dependent oxidoreductase [Streptosporangiaceae bacterium]